VSFLIMLGTIISGFVSGDFGAEGSAILGLPWGRVALIDLYVGLAIFGAWLAYREKSPAVVGLWWIALAVLGNLAAAGYLVRASWGSDDIPELLTGASTLS
jgi:hypothetical protein